jgi:hypothetical protein
MSTLAGLQQGRILTLLSTWRRMRGCMVVGGAAGRGGGANSSAEMWKHETSFRGLRMIISTAGGHRPPTKMAENSQY